MAYHPYDLRGRKHVFCDWALVEPGYGVVWGGAKDGGWEMPYGVRISSHVPRIDPEPLIPTEYPYEMSVGGMMTVFEDEGRFRLYYTGHYGGTNPEDEYDPRRHVLAYAESDDGVTWTKPSVGSVEFEGSKDNNIVFDDIGTVFKDPSAPADERYKLIYQYKKEGGDRVLGAVSPDGLRWTRLEQPLLTGYVSDTQIVAKFDEEQGKYIGYFRGWDRHEHGRYHGRRNISIAETETFGSWPAPRPIVTPDVQDGPDVDIYTNAYSPWPGGADAHLMFPVFYHRRLDVTQLHMMTSRDGLNWERHARKPMVPTAEPGTSGNPGLDWHTGVYAGCGVISPRPDEHSLLFHPSATSHNNLLRTREGYLQDVVDDLGYICRATWRKDGFTSIETETKGAFTTYPLVFTGSTLKVNAWTRFRGEIRVEVADASVETRPQPAVPIPGRTLADCDTLTGDILDGTVTWNGESDLSAWSGKQVRLRVEMTRARIHALEFV